jgi:hypothetical protein
MSDPKTLADRLLDPAVHPRLMSDCARLLDAEVARKRGLSGMAIKGAYKTVQAIKPGFIRGVTELLVGEWIVELEPDYRGWRDGGGEGSFGQALLRQRDAVAERMLRVTDRRAEGTPHKTAKKLYFKLRPGAKVQVVEALPGVGRVLDSHLET